MLTACLPRPASRYAFRPTITKHASCLASIGAFGLTSTHFGVTTGMGAIGTITGVDFGIGTGIGAIGTLTGVDFGVTTGIGAIGTLTGVDFGIGTGMGATMGVAFGA